MTPRAIFEKASSTLKGFARLFRRMSTAVGEVQVRAMPEGQKLASPALRVAPKQPRRQRKQADGADAPKVPQHVSKRGHVQGGTGQVDWQNLDPSGMKGRVSPLEFFRWADLAKRPDKEVEYVLENMIPQGEAGIFAAPPGLGKTFVAIQVMVAKAVGLPLWGLETGDPAGVIIAEFEQSPDSLRTRAMAAIKAFGTAWTQEHEMLMEQNFMAFTLGTAREGDVIHALDTTFRSSLPELESKMQMHGNVAWVVLDTLAWVSDDTAETDHLASRPLWCMALQLARKYGCGVTFVHHTRKANDRLNLPERMNPELLRGANSQEAQARVINQLGWLTQSDLKAMDLSPSLNPTRDYCVLGLTKFNDGPLPDAWLLLRHSQTPGCGGCWEAVPEGEELLGRLVVIGSAKARKTKQDEVLEAVQASLAAKRTPTVNEIAKTVYGADTPEARKTVRTTIARLVSKKLLREKLIADLPNAQARGITSDSDS